MISLRQFLYEKALKATKVADMTPEQKAQHLENNAAGKQWHKENPVHHANIVNHWNQATHKEKKYGKNWYKDAHKVAHSLAKETGIHRHQAAGLLANYSPQTDWHSNMITAARVARTKKAIGGKGQPAYHKSMGGRAMTSNAQKSTAHRILNGEHYDNVIKGHKVRAFAHLIDHGGNADPTKPHVCVDRHAMSVACGKRIPEHAFNTAGLKQKKKYDSVSHAYVKAAEHINKESGAKPGDHNHVEPHHVQATTWVVRQRLNDHEDSSHRAAKAAGEKSTQKKGSGGWDKIRGDKRSNWKNYSGTWHPSVSHLFEAESE